MQSALDKLHGPEYINFNAEVKYMYFFRFLSSYFIQPKYFVGFSQALDRYCEESHLNCLNYAGALDYILKGEKCFYNEIQLLRLKPFY